MARRSSSATTTSPSIAGAARAWRTSRVSRSDYPAAKMFRLEQNYRSTGNILKAANALIAQQHRAPRQEPLDRGQRRRTHQAVRRVQRARRGRVRHEPHPRLDEPRRRAARRGDSVSHQRAVARVRRNFHVGAHSVQGVRRPALLRARGNQGRARLPARHHQSRRRCLVRARGESAHARHRRQVARRDPRAGQGRRHLICGPPPRIASPPARWVRRPKPR